MGVRRPVTNVDLEDATRSGGEIRRHEDGEGDEDPDSPGEEIVVGEKFRPGLVCHKVAETELERQRHDEPGGTNGERRPAGSPSRPGWPVTAGRTMSYSDRDVRSAPPWTVQPSRAHDGVCCMKARYG